jgi:hypothetical protein
LINDLDAPRHVSGGLCFCRLESGASHGWRGAATIAKARRPQEAKEANLQIHLVKVIAKPYYADARACSDPLSAQFIQ